MRNTSRRAYVYYYLRPYVRFSSSKESIDIRPCDFIVREIRCRNPRQERVLRPFWFCARKNDAASWRTAQVSSSSIDRTLSVSCVYTSLGAVGAEVSWPESYPRGHRISALTLRRFRAYWKYNTFSSRFYLLSCRTASSFAAGLEDIVLKQKSVPREL